MSGEELITRRRKKQFPSVQKKHIRPFRDPRLKDLFPEASKGKRHAKKRLVSLPTRIRKIGRQRQQAWMPVKPPEMVATALVEEALATESIRRPTSALAQESLSATASSQESLSATALVLEKASATALAQENFSTKLILTVLTWP
jgi:hypothetical protein